MAMSVAYGNTADANALIYPLPDQTVVGFIQQKMQDATQQIVGAGQQFFDRAVSLYDQFAGEEAIRRAKAAKRASGSLWDENEVQLLSTIEQMQAANNMMRRWVMANPMVNRMYHRQQIEGYDGLYRDPFPDDKLEDNYDYRRVMNGVVQDVQDDEGEWGWTATTYIEDLMPDDHELDPVEQANILSTWEAVEVALKLKKRDPTSRWDADLG